MQNFHLKKSLNFALEDWIEVFRKDYHVDSVHVNRVKGYGLAREALIDLLSQEGIILSPQDLKVTNYNTIHNHPEFTMSLAHTPYVGAAFLVPKEKCKSVGIDLERNDRVVKDAIYQRIRHAGDEINDALQLWTLKEACFKALMNTGLFDKNTEFNSIKVCSNLSRQHDPSGLTGSWITHYQDEHVISLAWIKA